MKARTKFTVGFVRTGEKTVTGPFQTKNTYRPSRDRRPKTDRSSAGAPRKPPIFKRKSAPKERKMQHGERKLILQVVVLPERHKRKNHQLAVLHRHERTTKRGKLNGAALRPRKRAEPIGLEGRDNEPTGGLRGRTRLKLPATPAKKEGGGRMKSMW